MNNKHSPALHPQSRVALLGCPIHGLVKGGQITLANSTTRAYPQPAGSFDMAGATWSVERPGVPAVTLTPEQAAEATASGWQWRNKAMLSGSQRQLYGKALGGWLYIDSAGDRWLVTNTLESQNTDFVSPLSGTVTLTRFGDFGKPAESHTYPVTLAGLGQEPSQPQPLKMYNIVFDLVEISSAGLDVYALSPDGARAAIMINTTSTNLPSIYGQDLHYRYALGWLELSISGLGASASVSLSVLRTRAQTLQAQETITGSLDDSTFAIVWFATGNASVVQTGRYIMGVHWSGAAWSDIAFEFDSTHSTDAPSPSSDGSTATRTVSESSSHVLSLTGPAGLVQLVAEAEGHVVQTATSPGGVRSIVGGHEGTYDGAAIVNTISWSALANELPFEWGFVAGGVGVPKFLPLGSQAGMQTDLLCAIQFFLRIDISADDGNVSDYVDVIRYSAQVFGFRRSKLRGVDGPTTATYSAVLTSTGVAGGKTQIPHMAGSRYYGSLCPHTGQAVWLETQAVCWV